MTQPSTSPNGHNPTAMTTAINPRLDERPPGMRRRLDATDYGGPALDRRTAYSKGLQGPSGAQTSGGGHDRHDNDGRRKRRRLRWILALIAAAALAAAVAIFAWTKGAFLPRWILWEEKTLTLNAGADANYGDGGNSGGAASDAASGAATDNEGDSGGAAATAKEPSAIVLKHRHLSVQKDGAIAWESPEGILVQDFLWCDINHDDKNELILLCWRIGRYGNARPFWVEKDEKTWSQHIYIYEWRDNEIHALWMASDIGMDVTSFDFNTTDRLLITETSGRITAWDWLSWGLSLIREIEGGEGNMKKTEAS